MMIVSTAFPRPSLPLVVIVRVFPSPDTTDVCVAVAFPSFLLTIRTVVASTRVRATVSPYGLLPVTRSAPPSNAADVGNVAMAFQGRRAVCLSDSGLARNFASSKSFSFGPALAGCVPTDRIRITSSASWHSCPRGGGTEVTPHHANPPDDEMGRG